VKLVPLSSAKWSLDEIQILLARPSTHASEANDAAREREERYFAKKEAEERVETAATSMMEMKNCRVVTCKECAYTAAHQSDYCRLQSHVVKRHTADKRFFKCRKCGTRTHCYGGMMPTRACEVGTIASIMGLERAKNAVVSIQSCRSTNYVRVAMKDERKMQLESEVLLTRGEERPNVNT